MVKESAAKDVSDYSEISKFILSFIQALLKTGYYTPGHPETSRAREGLYNDLLSIFKGRREITFVAVTTKDRRDVMVDGVVDEPVNISSLMFIGMAEMFIPKFLEYFDRKNLSSFSIKASITRDEFENFIDIMSESPFQEEGKIDTRERYTLKLIKNNVLNVSTIFAIDLVGKERKLPWRVEIALTRLKRDLNLIPLYKNLSKEKMSELKNMVFDDIIRPIKSPALIKDIIVNLDIVSHDIAGISREEFEDRVTDFLHKDHLLLAAPEVLKFFILVKESYEKLQDESILLRLMFLKNITKKVGLKIISYGCSDKTLLMDYFNHGVLVVDELPENVSIKIKRHKEIEQFYREPQKYFIAMEEAKDEEEVGKIASLLLNFLPELFTRNYYTEAEEILQGVKKKGFNFFNIDSMLLNEIISSMEKKLEESKKEDQITILEMINLMDKISIIVLMNLIPHNSRIVRKIACEMLVKQGKAVIPVLKSTLKKREDWYFIRNAVMILGEVGQGSTELEEVFEEFLNHEEPRVRVEAVKGVVNIIGTDAEKLLIDALNDGDLMVRRKAVWALGKINSIKPEVIAYFIDTIAGKRKEDESIVEQVLSSVQSYPPELDETKQLEQAVLEALSKGYGILSRLAVEHVLSGYLKEKACETLGHIGSKKSIDLLKKIAKKDDQLIRGRALEAMERIQKRNN